MLSEQLTPQVLDERVKAARELLETRINAVDEKYDRWATTMDDDVDELDKKVERIEKDFRDDLHNLVLAQEKGERLVIEGAEKARVEKNRWMIGTVLAVVGLGVTIIADIILK